MTYSGDTRPTQGLLDLAQGSDVLLLQNMGPIAVSTVTEHTGDCCILQKLLAPLSDVLLLQNMGPTAVSTVLKHIGHHCMHQKLLA